MTLEQTTKRILAAVKAQDLQALERAARDRESAIALLPSLSPTSELRASVAASIEAGEEAKRTVRLIRHRMRLESRRLERIENGFIHAMRPVTRHRIDCEG